MNNRRTSAITRFWQKVNKNPVIGNTKCWIWTACTNDKGYGQIMNNEQIMVFAHRFSFELHKGKIPEGRNVCHRCDNPVCVNPKHLFLGTQKDNMQDCKSKGRTRNNPVTGTGHFRAKLTPAIVRFIRNHKWKFGEKKEYAAKIGVSYGLVLQIFSGKGWNHVK